MLFKTFRRVCLITLVFPLASLTAAEEPGAKEQGVREIKIEDIVLSAPADWKQEPPSNRLRLAQFVIPAAEGDKQRTEMVVSFFGGGGGGIDANIERWIEQFGNEGRKVKLTKGDSKQGTYYFVDVTGSYNMPVGPPILRQTQTLPDARMLGVILEVEGKGNYFLKMAGPTKTVSAAEEALRRSIGGDVKSEKPYELK